MRMDARVQKEGENRKTAIYCHTGKEDEDKIGRWGGIQDKVDAAQCAIEKRI